MAGNEIVLLLKTLFEAFLSRCVGKRDVLGHPRRKLISGFVLAVFISFALTDITVSQIYARVVGLNGPRILDEGDCYLSQRD